VGKGNGACPNWAGKDKYFTGWSKKKRRGKAFPSPKKGRRGKRELGERGKTPGRGFPLQGITKIFGRGSPLT